MRTRLQRLTWKISLIIGWYVNVLPYQWMSEIVIQGSNSVVGTSRTRALSVTLKESRSKM